MKTIGIVALAAIAALVLGFGARLGNQTAHAEADDSVVIGCEFLLSAIDGNLDDATLVWADPPTNTVPDADLIDACLNAIDADDVAALANVLGDEDDTLEASDFDDSDLDGNQVTDGGGSTLAFVFVNNDGQVNFDPEVGLTVAVHDDGCADTPAVAAGNCGAGEAVGATDSNAETCGAGEGLDQDCGTLVLDNGDGVVVATVTDGSGTPGDTPDVDMFQADDTGNVQTQTINIVGDPQDITLDVLKSPIQVSGTATEVSTCEDESDVSDAGQLGDINRTFLKATVTDDDDTELTRVGVEFSVDDDSIGTFDDDSGEVASADKAFTGVSVDAGAAGVGSFLVLCGGTDTGTVTVTASADGEEADAEVEVVGEAANMALTASPAAIDCDGAATSTVSATVTDADGNNVADGTSVNFSVVALGTANPINADTTAGVATSTITPLSGGVAGVTVVVSAGDAEASIRIDCNTPAAATATPGGPAPTPGGVIGGPDTGNGGYLGEDSAGFPMWTLVALALGSLALVTGGLVTRRVGK